MDISDYHIMRRQHDLNRAVAGCKTASVKLCSHLLIQWYESLRLTMTEGPISPEMSQVKPWLYDWQSNRYFAFWDPQLAASLGLGGEEVTTDGR